MAKIIFENVGKGKWNGVVDIVDNCNRQKVEEVAYKEVKKHLASRFPDVEYDLVTNKGEIFAGCHLVGTFHLEV